ncbi:hypothetical protein [Streptomyces sp. ICBB 8177]|uniref:hypothetical protein n=1 Tax=Streptomyces sp. ICBB 8177 TaxID=563922 RepID=UPI000D679603|nr:hypothetical protein [Streptomyces sp. ICBB 8177]PWI41153.1 hypothetical protein CK485_27825 [Streptomyces sp. ICBB 8177]
MLQAVRTGDYAPLIFYGLAVTLCLVLVLDVGRINSRLESRLKTGPLGVAYRPLPTWLFRCGPLFGLALITIGLLVL